MIDVAVILLLILLNGALAMSEAAVVASRNARLAEQARAGKPGAAAALRASESPVEFLSTVQVGITMIGIVSGVFGGAVLAGDFAAWMLAAGVPERVARPGAMVGVVLVITYFSLVLGELAPKRLAIEYPESIARVVAPPIALLTLLTSPAVRFLSISTGALLQPLGVGARTTDSVSDEEIRSAIRLGAATGVLDPRERDVIERVFRLADLRVGSFVIPRADVECLAPDASPERIAGFVRRRRATHFPVSPGGLDQLVGVVSLVDLAHTRGLSPGELARPALFIPETASALHALELFRGADAQIAFVTDEHGTVQGMIRLVDLVEDMLGEPGRPAGTTSIVDMGDGRKLVDGLLAISDWLAHVDGDGTEAMEPGSYQTVGGMVVHHLGRIASEGDRVEIGAWVFEVVETDGRRVDRVLASRRPASGDA